MQQHCFQRRPMHQPYFGSRQSLAAGHARSTNNSNPSFVQHRRANSDHQFGETSHGLFSTDDSIEQNLQNYLPKSLIDELVDSSEPQQHDEPITLIRFEKVLTDQGADEALKIINNLVGVQTDPKEKGKLLRAAAEISRRLAQILLSLELYAAATEVDPGTPASWIDRARLLDEIGNWASAEEVLQQGVRKVQQPEQLIRKLLKSFERTNSLHEARMFLGSLYQDKNVDRSVVLTEGLLFELRQGNVDLAMAALKMIRGPSGWKPNIYSELVQYYERAGMIQDVFEIVEEGARLNPRNAVVCQALLRNQPNPMMAIQILNDCRQKRMSAFTDKMTITVCETLAQKGHLRQMRTLLADAIVNSSSQQRYKLLLTASMMELMHGDASLAPLLVDQTVQWTPYKAKPMVFVLWAKMHELNGEDGLALPLFERTVREYSAEWRVYLELAQFHLHRNRVDKAIEVIDEALKVHKGTGRLWAFRVQLEAFVGVEAQIMVLRKAINAVPKSGEVWCEAARIALNPLTEYFNLASAKQYLEFAYRFTPQHGDSLIEMIRLEILEKGPQSHFRDIQKRFLYSEGNYGMLFMFIRQLDERSLVDVFEDAVREVQADVARNREVYARAIARSSFVVQSIAEEKEKLYKMKSSEPASKFAFGLTNFTEMVLNPSLCETREQMLSIVLGTAAAGT